MECKSLRESGKKLKEYDIAYFGASCDPLERNREFANKLKLDYPLLSDFDGNVARAYGILRGRWAERVTIFIDKEGRVAHVESKVDVRKHGEQVLKTLQRLKVPRKSANE